MKITKGYNVQIWCGLKERDTEYLHSIEEVKTICQKFVDEVGQCVSVTPTEFIYTKGNEEGVVVGFIIYPRFPKKKKQIRNLSFIGIDFLVLIISYIKYPVYIFKKKKNE